MSDNTGTVLVVDDDEDIAEVLVIILRGLGYGALHAADGDVALRLLRAMAQLPDAILLDLMMPVMDGEQFRAEQLRDPRIADIPVLVMSGAGHPEHAMADLHPSAYLVKPLDIDVLRSALQRVM